MALEFLGLKDLFSRGVICFGLRALILITGINQSDRGQDGRRTYSNYQSGSGRGNKRTHLQLKLAINTMQYET